MNGKSRGLRHSPKQHFHHGHWYVFAFHTVLGSIQGLVDPLPPPIGTTDREYELNRLLDLRHTTDSFVMGWGHQTKDDDEDNTSSTLRRDSTSASLFFNCRTELSTASLIALRAFFLASRQSNTESNIRGRGNGIPYALRASLTMKKQIRRAGAIFTSHFFGEDIMYPLPDGPEGTGARVIGHKKYNRNFFYIEKE